jgi:biopolymer transport protein ExbB/TolQ
MLEETYKVLTNPISIIVIGWLGLYFFLVFYIFFNKYFFLNKWLKREEEALNTLLMTNNISDLSSLSGCLYKNDKITELSFDACILAAKKTANRGVVFLSVVASTSPFIGLFGTVVGILKAFSNMQTTSSINMIAPLISEALVATAIGILVAIPAYSFHQVLSKKIEDLMIVLNMQKDFYLNNEKA